MKHCLTLALGALLSLVPCPSPLRAQQTPQEYTLQAPPPPKPIQVGAGYSGPAGSNTYYYWIVANYPIGNSGVAGPAQVSQVGTLSGANTVRIGWTAVDGATTYDVLRTTTPFFPSSGSCVCSIATAVSGTTTTDTGGGVSSYTVTSVNVALGRMRLNNRDSASARIEFLIGNTVVVAFDSTGIVVGGGAGDVTAASAFGADNVLIRSDGTGKGLQASGVSVDDSDNMNLPGTLTVGSAGSANPITWEGATPDGTNVVNLMITDPTAPRTMTVPDANSVVPIGQTCSAGDFINSVNPTTGVITCGTPASGSFSVLCSSVTQQDFSSGGADQVLATCPIAGGTLQAGDRLHIVAHFIKDVSDANTWIPALSFHASSLNSGRLTNGGTYAGTILNTTMEAFVAIKTSTTQSYYGEAHSHATGTASVKSANNGTVDVTSASNVYIGVTCNAANTCSMTDYIVTRIRP